MTAAATAAQERAPTDGLLRLFVVLHESQSLGAGTSVLRALPALEAFGWTATAWFPGSGALVDSPAPLAERVVRERPLAASVAGWRESPGVASRAARTPAYLRDLRRALERARPHVVHANTLLSLPEALVARSCGLPLVVHVHELPDVGLKRASAIRLAARSADVLVGVSDAVAAMLLTGSGRTPVHTVRNGVAVPRESRVASPDDLVVGTVGTVSRVKGTDTYLRAAGLARGERPALRFEHVGAPDLHRDRGLDDELHAIAREQGGTPPVLMLGSVPAASVLPRWSVFVLPSRTEGFPLATLEAMALGIPVIASAVGGVPEQIEHLRTGILVRPGDHEAIATWLVRLHDDEALRLRLGEAGRARVLAELTLERQAEGLHRAYLTALNRQFGPPAARRRAAVAP